MSFLLVSGCSSAKPPAAEPAAAAPATTVAAPQAATAATPAAAQPVAPAASPAAAVPAAASGELTHEANLAWQKRDARASLDEAVDRWQKRMTQDGNDVAAATSLARAYYFLADSVMVTTPNDDSVLAMYEKGIGAGERALLAASPELQARVKSGGKIEDALRFVPPSAQAALYWYASNLGRYAVGRGFTTILFYRERIFAVMQRVLAIDETFYYGAPHRYLGTYYARLPTFAGGDLKKAREHFEKAAQLGPDFFGTKVLWAESYATRSEDRVLFQKLLTEVINGDLQRLPDLLPEQRLEQEKARRLLARIDELF